MSEEIILCTECGGKGYINCRELVDYHKGEYKYWTHACNRCKSTGRLVKSVITSFTPFIPKGDS